MSEGAHGAEAWVLSSDPVPQERFGSFVQPCELKRTWPSVWVLACTRLLSVLQKARTDM